MCLLVLGTEYMLATSDCLVNRGGLQDRFNITSKRIINL